MNRGPGLIYQHFQWFVVYTETYLSHHGPCSCPGTQVAPYRKLIPNLPRVRRYANQISATFPILNKWCMQLVFVCCSTWKDVWISAMENRILDMHLFRRSSSDRIEYTHRKRANCTSDGPISDQFWQVCVCVCACVRVCVWEREKKRKREKSFICPLTSTAV